MLKISKTIVATAALTLAASTPALAEHSHHDRHAGHHHHMAQTGVGHYHHGHPGWSRRVAAAPEVVAPAPGVVDDGVGLGVGLADTGIGLGADAVGAGLDLANLGIGIGTGAADAGLGVVDPYGYPAYPADRGVPVGDQLF